MLQRLDRTDFKSNVEDAGFRLGACLALECCFPVDKWDSCFNYRGSQHALRRIHESKTTREREKFLLEIPLCNFAPVEDPFQCDSEDYLSVKDDLSCWETLMN